MASGIAGIGPLTDQVFGQNVAVARAYAFTPGNATGPVPSGPGYAPLATLPPGASANYGAGGGAATAAASQGGGGFALGGINWRTILLLGGVFVVAILGMQYVHWKA